MEQSTQKPKDSFIKNTGDNLTRVSGFYYDEQLRNPFLSIGLYPNTEPNGKETDGWGPVDNPDEDSPAADYQYSKFPICKAIISQDFNVSISNSFTNFGGDPIGQLWNNNRQMAPYASSFAKILNQMTEKGKEFGEGKYGKEDPNGKSWGNAITSFITTVTGKLAKGLENNAELLSKALVVQGTRFTYYSDTDISFGSNFGLRFTIFPAYGEKTTSLNGQYVGNNFQSVDEQLSCLIPYVIGDFIPVDSSSLGATVDEFIKKVASWQLPPAGFRADLKDVDNVQRGTMKLRIGPYFAIENLVIENAQFNFSKSMVKNPDSGEISPAWCEVNLMLRPATKFSKNTLTRFISGDATSKFRKEVEDDMKSNLSKIKSEMLKMSKKYGQVTIENSSSDAENL